MPRLDTDLPGAELVRPGLEDLAAGRHTVEALVVSVAPERLRELGHQVNHPVPDAEIRLWELLAESDSDDAHSRLNAILRRLDSLLRAAVGRDGRL